MEAPGFASAINGPEIEGAECGRNGLACLVGNVSGESPMPISRLDIASVSEQKRLKSQGENGKCEYHSASA